MANIEIRGVEKLKMALQAIPTEIRPMVLRGVSAKPAQKVAAEARRIQPIGETGRTAKTIGVKRVVNQKEPFVRVGYKGRSLGNIYTSGEYIVRRTGTLEGFPRLFHAAADKMAASCQREMNIELSRIIVRGLKKYGYTSK